MACEDIEVRTDSVIQKVTPPALPVAKQIETPADKEQHNNVLRLFFNRLTDAVNKLTDKSTETEGSFENVDTTITELQTEITNLGDEVTNLGDEVAGDAGTRKYRYWKLHSATGSGASFVQLEEISMFEFDPASGVEVDVAPEAILTSTPHSLGNPVDHLNDGLVNTGIAPTGWSNAAIEAEDFFILWDFGDTPRAIVAMRQYMAYLVNNDSAEGYFSTFEIDVSDDGIDYTRTFYVSWQYDDVTDILPAVESGSWSERYWLETTDKPPPAEGGGGGEIYWNFQLPEDNSTPITAVDKDFWLLDIATVFSDQTLTLPASPEVGERVGFALTRTSGTYDVILDGGSYNIGQTMQSSGPGTTFTVNPRKTSYPGILGLSLIFEGTTRGWVVYDTAYSSSDFGE